MTELPDLADVVDELLDRRPETDMAPTLDRVARVMDLAGDPQKSLQIVHITGTNGKTSVARMTEALLRGAGLRTGMFTSPHLRTVTERICVDGESISEERFVAAYEDLRPLIAMVDAQEEREGRAALTFFEVLTCMAYAVFADAPVDAAVVEVGLGGAWDATNVGDGRVAVVTPVALDHQDWLGSSIEQIAREKAGIIKPGATVVSARQSPSVAAILRARAEQVGAHLLVAGTQVDLVSRSVAVGGQVLSIQGRNGRYDDIFLPLTGPHQAENAVLAVAAAEAFLVESDPLDTRVVDALGGVVSPGRLEVVSREPTVLVDAAHNPAGARALAAALHDSYHFPDLVAVIAVMADKDLRGILTELAPSVSLVIATHNSSARTARAEQVAALAGEILGEDRVLVAPDLADALAQARALAVERGGAVLATGSVVTAGDVAALAAEEAAG